MNYRKIFTIGVAILAVCALSVPAAFANGCPSTIPVFPGSDAEILDPACIAKYEIPLVIPPVMNDKQPKNSRQDKYNIAVREFGQQILPGGIWNALGATTQTFPATTVWSYGPDADPVPDSSALGGGVGVAPAPNSQFNYPAYTFETMADVPVEVRWINDLKENFGAGPDFLRHLLAVDQTLHWANPVEDCRAGLPRTDCSGDNPLEYTGPVPIVTHVHGAHVDPHSDGYPEAWWLPAGVDTGVYTPTGSLFDDANGQAQGSNSGYADYLYRQDQPATTLWYHDHSLGMTRLNVYAGPAGFWMMRGGPYDGGTVTSTGKMARLPGPAPKAKQSVLELNLPTHNIRQSVREIPIVIQDRDFTDDSPLGSKLYYPDNRARFEELNPEGGSAPFLEIDFVPESDVAPIWNPEAFFNVMVVNGVAWPVLEVAQAKYRLRFLNGCNSRFLILKFSNPDVEVYQIGAEQGFLPTPISLNAFTYPQRTVPLNNNAYILMALAERADTIVDFSTLAPGTQVELLNIGPDEPFGGGVACLPGDDPEVEDCDFAPADPTSSGLVMKFVVNAALNGKGMTDPYLPNDNPNPKAATDPGDLTLNAEPALGNASAVRNLSLNELDSEVVCVKEDGDDLVQIFDSATEDPLEPPDCEDSVLGDVDAEPFGPLEALLGTAECFDGASPVRCSDPNVDSYTTTALKWTAPDVGVEKVVPLENGSTVNVWVTENPEVGATEEWEILNDTADAHPIHLHLVRFEVLGRTVIGGGLSVAGSNAPLPWETGFKDTFISYPGEVSTVKAKFDIEGLYVWHCHIVEHEDNEMMRPYVVGLEDANGG
jgi:FtsP/CotA-like multicopper oxidase with cupredoxin domain